MRPNLQGLSLRMKIIMPYLILALLLAGGATYITTRVTADSISERFDNQLIEAGKLSSEYLVKEENRLLETLRLIAFTDGVPVTLEQADAEQLRELVYPIAVNSQTETLDILDTRGVAVLSLRHRIGGKIEEYEFSRGDTAMRDQPWVRQALNGIADALGNKYAGLITLQSQPFLYVVGPIFNPRGELAGVVMVGKSLNSLAREIRQATLAQVTFYDASKQPLATTFLESPSADSQAIPTFFEQETSVSIIRDARASNIDYGEIVGLWQVRREKTMGWIGTAFAKNFIVRLSQNTWMQILLSVTLSFLLVLAIGWIIASRIAKPILKLEQAATQVADGNLNVQVKPQGNDEIAHLTTQFNGMVANLSNSKHDLITAYDMSIVGWAKALDMRDRDTEDHSQRVTELTLHLARAMGISESAIDNIRRGAILHDIGKMAIPDHILLKPGPLNTDEWVVMRKHPLYAIEMIDKINFLHGVMEIPAYHHERWDGTGYPFGLKGEQIPLAARIFKVVDVWDALLSDRPYRRALSKQQAREIISASSGKEFDTHVVDMFLQLIEVSEKRDAP
jgi:putative nucleotidyltransferase with HDIG domain